MTDHMDLAAALEDERYLSLTTFRRTGAPVPTPVWFVPQPNGILLVYTEADSGKVKRLRHTPGCTVAACDVRGKVHGRTYRATAEILVDEVDLIHQRLRRRYGWQAAAFDLVSRLRHRGSPPPAVGLRLTGVAGD